MAAGRGEERGTPRRPLGRGVRRAAQGRKVSHRNLTRDLFSSRPRGPRELLPEVFAGLCKMSSVALRHGVAGATPEMGRPLAHVARVSACEVPIPEPPFPRTSAARLLSRAGPNTHAPAHPSLCQAPR